MVSSAMTEGRCIYYNDLMEAIYRHGGNMSVYESKYSQWIEKLGDDRRDSMTFQTTDIEITVKSTTLRLLQAHI